MDKMDMPGQVRVLFAAFVFIVVFATVVIGWPPKESSAEELDYPQFSKELHEHYLQYEHNKITTEEMLIFCNQAIQEAGEGKSAKAMYAYIILSLTLARDDLEGSLAAAQQAVEHRPPGIGNPYLTLGDALVAVGRLSEAADAYEKVVKSRPDLEPYIRELRTAVIYDTLTFEAEFAPDKEAENEKLGSLVTVRGELASIEDDLGGTPFLTLKGAHPGREIVCGIDPKDPQLTNLKVGQKVTVCGLYEGALPRTLITVNRIVKIEP